ncbi:MAG: hypothetical protein J5827_00205 [Oscillospiraceae bacterium]|nr:hypothetical protein [Oscillospiraceae bacterium]
MSDVKKLAAAAMIAAAETALLCLAGVLPSGRIALTAAAALGAALVTVECGRAYALASFAVSAAAALLISPLKLPAAIYALFLGWYPVLKSVLERRVRPPLQLPLKLAALLAAEALIYPAYSVLMGRPPLAAAAAAAAVSVPAFIVYDRVMSALIQIYINGKTKK